STIVATPAQARPRDFARVTSRPDASGSTHALFRPDAGARRSARDRVSMLRRNAATVPRTPQLYILMRQQQSAVVTWRKGNGNRCADELSRQAGHATGVISTVYGRDAKTCERKRWRGVIRSSTFCGFDMTPVNTLEVFARKRQ